MKLILFLIETLFFKMIIWNWTNPKLRCISECNRPLAAVFQSASPHWHIMTFKKKSKSMLGRQIKDNCNSTLSYLYPKSVIIPWQNLSCQLLLRLLPYWTFPLPSFFLSSSSTLRLANSPLRQLSSLTVLNQVSSQLQPRRLYSQLSTLSP